jgi:hypothetical protein
MNQAVVPVVVQHQENNWIVAVAETATAIATARPRPRWILSRRPLNQQWCHPHKMQVAMRLRRWLTLSQRPLKQQTCHPRKTQVAMKMAMQQEVVLQEESKRQCLLWTPAKKRPRPRPPRNLRHRTLKTFGRTSRTTSPLPLQLMLPTLMTAMMVLRSSAQGLPKNPEEAQRST